MKSKNIYLYICLLFSISLSAQQTEFAPIGTEWYYEVVNHNFYNSRDTSYILIKSTYSKIINGKLCNVISNVKGGMLCYDFGNPTYAYQSNDTVYFCENYVVGTFKPVHIWNAQQGDTWETLFGVKIRIDSIKTVSIFEQPMRAQYVTYISNECYDCATEYHSFVIENIGDLFYLYGFSVNGVNACDEFMRSYNGLTCYIHPELGTYNTNNRQCNYETVSVQEITEEQIKIFDNYIQIPMLYLSKNTEVKFYNISGQPIFTSAPDNNGIISTNKLFSGMYFVCINTSNQLTTFKFIKK